MNMKENSLLRFIWRKKDIIGLHDDWKGDLELLNIIMIGMARKLTRKRRKL